MKRRRLSILFACVTLAVSVIVAWGTWRRIAYVDVSSVIKRPVEELGSRVFKKRWSWLPVPTFWIPDFICFHCGEYSGGTHTHSHRDPNGLGVSDYVHMLQEDAKSSGLNITYVQARREGLRFAHLRICQQCYPGRTAR